MMKVLLSGYNIDADVINELLEKSPGRKDVTPETLSASYARISRDSRPVDELRKIAREEVEKARKSNKTIIFKMGHHSIAEHAVFNFDIIGISRLAIEEIEHFRLNSFTEKSQRYITLENDFVIPEEIKNTQYEEMYISTVKLQNDLYHRLYDKLKDYVFKKHPELAKDPKEQNTLDGWAKEDARYITALATEGQLGQTINARNLELILRRFASSKLSEVRELGKRLYSLVAGVAPSIILFYEKNDYDEKAYSDIKASAKEIIIQEKYSSSGDNDEVRLVNYANNADNIVLASLLHTTGCAGFGNCMEEITEMLPEVKRDLFKTACRYMEFYDSPPREFEYVNLTFDMIVSASCFAQLKRHRMATLTAQAYNPALGVKIPASITAVEMEEDFRQVISRTENVYNMIKNEIPEAAPYILTNAHRRRVLFRCNARELYHVARLREDAHAQWDIRDISTKMRELAQEIMPLTMLLIGGKDKYHEIYEQIYSTPPKLRL